MRAAVACCVALVLALAVLAADDHSVIFDEDVDFAAFKTFAVREVRVVSERPELTFPAVAKALATTVRTALAKRLKEVPDQADLMVECRVTGVDYGIGPYGRASVIPPGRAGRGGQARTLNVDFTEATMVIDLTSSATAALVWRGVYHDTEKDPQVLASALIEDATRLLAQFTAEEEMMPRRLVTFAVLLFATIAVRAVDDISIQVDPHTDFSRFSTFAIRGTKIDSPRPELDNPLFVKKLNTTVRTALGTRGLKETADRPDLLVNIVLSGEDVSTTQRGAIRGAGPTPLMYTSGRLTIELSRSGDPSPVWRGIYRDDEKTGSKLMAKLPDDARKLIDRYPKR